METEIANQVVGLGGANDFSLWQLFLRADFVVKALQPAEVMKVVLYDEDERLEVVVPEDQLSLAIGRRGQNVRLASELSGWEIDILTEDKESERRQKEFHERTNLFIDALDVDELLAQLLVTEGFSRQPYHLQKFLLNVQVFLPQGPPLPISKDGPALWLLYLHL